MRPLPTSPPRYRAIPARFGYAQYLLESRIPGAQPDLLAANPIEITAEMRLDQPTRPIHFSLAHPLITADGEAVTAGNLNGKLKLDLPNLAPMAMLAGTRSARPCGSEPDGEP